MATEAPESLLTLLGTLTQYLSSTNKSAPEASSLLAPKDGISLLDVKNELFLSYLQNLVFLILLKLRHRSGHGAVADDEERLDDKVVKKLVELRVYLERGVRRLEGDLTYQINKVIQAAEDAARASVAVELNSKGKKGDAGSSNEEDSGSDDEDTDEDSDHGLVKIDDLQYRPNISAFTRPSTASQEAKSSTKEGVYKPPRITATSMPLATTGGPRTKNSRLKKSSTMEEFISAEHSTTPMAEPSIGSGIVGRGRRTVSEREKREERERRDYEETNFVRLPAQSKKELREKRKRDGGTERMGFGGEEWRGLNEGVERIEKLTRRKNGGTSGALERSRKRKADSRGAPLEIGQGFQKRIRTLDIEKSHQRKKR